MLMVDSMNRAAQQLGCSGFFVRAALQRARATLRASTFVFALCAGALCLLSTGSLASAQDLPDDDTILVHPNNFRGPVRVSLDAIRARYSDGSISGGVQMQQSIRRLVPEQGTVVAESCGIQWQVGMRVIALSDNPSGMPCVAAGEEGTIMSAADTGELLVEWRGKFCGHDGNGNGVTPTMPNDGRARWFVDCDEVAPLSNPPTTPVLLNFAGFIQGELPLSYYNGGTGSYGTGPGPASGATFLNESAAYNFYNGSNEPSPGILALIPSDNTMNINFANPIRGFSYYYTSSVNVTLRAYSGPNGTGTLVSTSTFGANSNGPAGNKYNTWNPNSWSWTDDARSITLTGTGNFWALDNISFENTPPCPGGDCNNNGVCDANELAGNDCNGNGVLDVCDISSGAAQDCNGNGTPDSCDIASGTPDCNGNGVPDSCDIASGAPDCNNNGRPDSCDLQNGSSLDCNGNGIPDSCDIASGNANDVNGNGIPDSCETDCNGNGVPDAYEVAAGLTPDCNLNGIPDSCDIAGGATDCDSDGVIDSCELAAGSAADCNGNGTLDNCDIASGAPDCNSNGRPDSCDIASGSSPDCNGNGVPDSCDLAAGTPDCNANGIPDSCDLSSGTPDCNGNGIPDSCDIASGADPDPEGDGIPNSCEPPAGIRLTGPAEASSGTCAEIGSELVFDIFVDNPPVQLVAGQFGIAYDNTVLEFIDVVGGEEPFTYVPLSTHDAATGKLFFIASVQEGGTGTLADSRVARMRFRAIANDCDGSAQVSFDSSLAPVLIANGGGTSVDLPLTNPAAVRIVTGAPVLSGVPAGISVPADAGAGCQASRTLVPPTASSSCGSASVSWTRSDSQPLNAPWPCGTTTVTWSATDICGRVTTDTTSVTVSPYHLLDVSIAYEGSSYAASMTRCIDLASGAYSGEVLVTFLHGVGTTTVQVPVGAYDCATADDDLHSLTARSGVGIQGTNYAVVFAGASALVNGDLTDDNKIDVTDWGIAVVTIGTSAAVNTDCSTTGYHVDFDGNGTVNSVDGSFVLGRFLRLGLPACGEGGFADGGRASISVVELAQYVGSAAIEADLNGDAMVDQIDIELWLAQNGSN